MEDFQTPPAPEDRLAVVIIHGIGNQQPLDTLLPFANNLIEKPALPGEPKFWSKPDRLSESFELRRLTARKSATRPTTDFYEYYWAHRIPGATYKQIITWIRRLLGTRPSNLLPKIRKFWYFSWATIVLAVLGYAYILYDKAQDNPFFESETYLITGVGIALVLPILSALVNHFALKYVGDAARYLQPDPENIALRHEIRAKGIKLMRDLHTMEDGKQRYSRIVLVGHSLGSVIAYDILKNLWDEFNKSMESDRSSILEKLEESAYDLEKLEQETEKNEEAIEVQRNEFRQLQRLYWHEQRSRVKEAGKPAWLVSDLVTLGSPLVHANVLLNTSISSLADRKKFKELPTCPPQMTFHKKPPMWRFSYNKWQDNRPTPFYVPDHAAVFSSTVWTNMYFPGDIVGDALRPIFGAGIQDIKLEFPPSLSKKHNSATSHTVYWQKVAESTDHLIHLREILGFNKTAPSSRNSIASNFYSTVSFTKYNTMLGMQCQKALWLDAHQPELKEPLSESDLLRFELGNAVDKEGKRQYGDGIEVKAVDWQLAVNRTRAFIDGGAKRLYQPAFEYNGLRIRSDILDINPDGSCVLREVKMSTSKKDEHVQDIALQMYVLQGNGFNVDEALLVTVDKEYVAGSSTSLFTEHNVTQEAVALTVQLDPLLSGHQEVLDLDYEPVIAIGPHCTNPWTCAFKAYCWQDVPEDSIFTVPRLHAKKKEQLLEQQIHRVAEIPDDFPLSDKQRAYVSLIKSGADQTDKTAIQEALNALPKPFYFLDFETFATPFPFWTGIKPNQQVPFQYSCHKIDENDELSHHAFLHTSLEDPRPAIISSLLSWIGDTGSIMVYNASFERRVLELLATSAPEHAPKLNAMTSRLFDQLDLVKAHVAHPGLLGSNSLKKVSEVILRDVIDFNALEIGEGASAQASWYKMVNLPEAQRDSLAAALNAYCELDTRAQVELHKWFVK